MKKTVRNILILFIMLTLIIPFLKIDVSAAQLTVSGGASEINQSISIPVSFNAENYDIYGVDATVNFDSKILSLNSVSGASAFNIESAGNAIFTDTNFNLTNPSKKCSYKLNFTAKAKGTSEIKITLTAGGINSKQENKSDTITKTVKVNVTEPKLSSNADLSSIKLNKGSLSPAFKANVTEYTAKVKYDVDEITISATPADGKSRVIGGGTFALQVGENEKFINVTAEDNTKKTYKVNIIRMSEQETQEAEQAERDANPLLVVINGNDYKIVNDLTNVTVPAGFTKTTAMRKESEITVLKDEAEKYELCWLVDQNGENGAFYSRDQEDNFTRLVYISVGEKMYIIEDFDMVEDLPEGFEFSNCTIAGIEVKSIGYINEGLKDFNIFNCYINGKNDYYRLDSVDGTMQRALDFSIALQNNNDTQQITTEADIQPQTENKKGISKTGLLVLGLVVAVAILLVVLAIVLIVKIASSNQNDEYEELQNTLPVNDFVLQDIEYVNGDPIKENQIDDNQNQ